MDTVVDFNRLAREAIRVVPLPIEHTEQDYLLDLMFYLTDEMEPMNFGNYDALIDFCIELLIMSIRLKWPGLDDADLSTSNTNAYTTTSLKDFIFILHSQIDTLYAQTTASSKALYASLILRQIFLWLSAHNDPPIEHFHDELERIEQEGETF